MTNTNVSNLCIHCLRKKSLFKKKKHTIQNQSAEVDFIPIRLPTKGERTQTTSQYPTP